VDSVAPGRRELFAFGVDLVKKLRGRADLFDAGVMLGGMESTEDRLHRLSTHYVVTVSNLGDPLGSTALAVNLEGWHPLHGRTSRLIHNEYVLPADFPRRLDALITEVLRMDAELREHQALPGV
jgi:hypothetical protein